jgi:hypothetical protein
MQSSVLGRCLPHIVGIDYALLPTLNSGLSGGEDEPLAACTVRLVRSGTLCEERPLAAWHFPPSGQPILMPIEETGEATDEMYAGRFLLLPRRDLTLALVDGRGEEQSFVQLRLAPAGSRCCEGDGGIAAWRVFVVLSDGMEIALQRSGSSPFITSVGALYLSDTQCCAFVRLGGLLHAEDRAEGGSSARLVTTHNLTWVGDEPGKPGFALHTHAVPQEGEPVTSCAITRSFRVAVERGRLNLSDCWLLLPVTCQGCLQPVVGEIAYVETLWGKMHPGCAVASPRQVSDGDLEARAQGRELAGTNPYQLALPGVVR